MPKLASALAAMIWSCRTVRGSAPPGTAVAAREGREQGGHDEDQPRLGSARNALTASTPVSRSLGQRRCRPAACDGRRGRRARRRTGRRRGAGPARRARWHRRAGLRRSACRAGTGSRRSTDHPAEVEHGAGGEQQPEVAGAPQRRDVHPHPRRRSRTVGVVLTRGDRRTRGRARRARHSPAVPAQRARTSQRVVGFSTRSAQLARRGGAGTSTTSTPGSPPASTCSSRTCSGRREAGPAAGDLDGDSTPSRGARTPRRRCRGRGRPSATPLGRASRVPEKRWPPRCVVSQVGWGQRRPGRGHGPPSSAQQRSRRPLVQTSHSRSSYGASQAARGRPGRGRSTSSRPAGRSRRQAGRRAAAVKTRTSWPVAPPWRRMSCTRTPRGAEEVAHRLGQPASATASRPQAPAYSTKR